MIPFSMGPVGGPMSKIGVQLTDSNYVLLCMRIMTRVSADIWEVLGENDFVRCVHSMGCPRPVQSKTESFILPNEGTVTHGVMFLMSCIIMSLQSHTLFFPFLFHFCIYKILSLCPHDLCSVIGCILNDLCSVI